MRSLTSIAVFWPFARSFRMLPSSSVRCLAYAMLFGLIVSATLACNSDPPRSGERSERDDGTATTAAPSDTDRSSTGLSRFNPSKREGAPERNYVPKVLGTKVFSARNTADLEPYFSASEGRSLTPDAMFDLAEEMFDQLPQDGPVFQPDTPVIVIVVMFDCRPTGNIELEGTTRLVNETVPGDPIVVYGRPFSILRQQDGDDFTISTSSGRGCMDNLNSGAPAGGWEAGTYRVEYRDVSGSLLVAIPFEVAGAPSSRPATSQGPRGDGLQLWIDVSLEPLRPGAQIAVNSNIDISPGDLLAQIILDQRGFRIGFNVNNNNLIAGGTGFIPMDFDSISLPPQVRWHEISLVGVSAAISDVEFECLHDVAVSDRRRQHVFDDRKVYFCSRAGASSGGAVQGAPVGQATSTPGRPAIPPTATPLILPTPTATRTCAVSE